MVLAVLRRQLAVADLSDTEKTATAVCGAGRCGKFEELVVRNDFLLLLMVFRLSLVLAPIWFHGLTFGIFDSMGG